MSKDRRKKAQKSSGRDKSDTTDITKYLNISVSNTKCPIATYDQNFDKAIRQRFDKSTDSLDSLEEEKESVFKHSKSNTRMFSWSDKHPKPKKIDVIHVDSDSSDEFMHTSKHIRRICDKCKTCHKKQLEEKSENKEDISPVVIKQYDNTIAGIKVKFPVKPYPCQMAVMNKVKETLQIFFVFK